MCRDGGTRTGASAMGQTASFVAAAPNGREAPIQTFPPPPRNGEVRPRLCENAQEPTRRRIVFSIALLPTAATALFVSTLTKSRRTFYAQSECVCFHTAWPLCGHSPAGMKSGRPRPPTFRNGMAPLLHGISRTVIVAGGIPEFPEPWPPRVRSPDR
jgi:hypothetical protein